MLFPLIKNISYILGFEYSLIIIYVTTKLLDQIRNLLNYWYTTLDIKIKQIKSIICLYIYKYQYILTEYKIISIH